VENEFGSNKPCDAAHYDYMVQLRSIYREHLGEEVVLLTVDGDRYIDAEGLRERYNFIERYQRLRSYLQQETHTRR